MKIKRKLIKYKMRRRAGATAVRLETEPAAVMPSEKHASNAIKLEK